VAEANAAGPGTATYRHCDIGSRAEVNMAFDAAVAELGGLDVLAAIAGVERGGPAEDVDDETWDLIFTVNVRGTMVLNQAAFRNLKETGGSIINVGSDAGLAGYRGLSAYGASKGAVMAWTRTAALEWGQYAISVNSLVPAIWTPMYQTHRDRMAPTSSPPTTRAWPATSWSVASWATRRRTSVRPWSTSPPRARGSRRGSSSWSTAVSGCRAERASPRVREAARVVDAGARQPAIVTCSVALKSSIDFDVMTCGSTVLGAAAT
jgi:NAD(P)-dependent dehydrogenase (short-subunit alcohol dehydrogenase family)